MSSSYIKIKWAMINAQASNKNMFQVACADQSTRKVEKQNAMNARKSFLTAFPISPWFIYQVSLFFNTDAYFSSQNNIWANH